MIVRLFLIFAYGGNKYVDFIMIFIIYSLQNLHNVGDKSEEILHEILARMEIFLYIACQTYFKGFQHNFMPCQNI